MVPHINLSSFAGGGKTTISKLLLEKYKTVIIPKITTRAKRFTEKEVPEYIFVSQEEFGLLKSQEHFLAVEEITNKGIHYHAIPKIEYWPSIPEGTELIISAFGEQARIVQKFIPEIKLIFIGIKDKKILADRLFKRCAIDGSNFEKKWALNERYFSENFQNRYDFVVYNDTTPEECVEQIITITKIQKTLIS
jgi:guanylate kinase